MRNLFFYEDCKTRHQLKADAINMMQAIKSNKPLYLPIVKRFPKNTSGINIPENAIIQNILVDSIFEDSTAIGFIMAVSPKTDAILNIFDPMRFPREIAFSFLTAAITDAANSGTLVPIAITVTEIA